MSTLKLPVSSEDHMHGSPNAPVILVEYGDFECPHCAAVHIVLKKLENQFKSRMAFVFRHFPLSQVHEYAKIAAISSEAAANQGKFWEMHDMIFENQSKLSTVYLLRMAETLGLEMKSFQRDTYDQKLADKVDSQFESGIMSGVNGTPSFYINGKKYNGAYDYESMSAAIEQVQLVWRLSINTT
jgi:protein-disulfide isomerase